MKVIIVVGARPNFMKAAPITAAIRRHNADRAADAHEPIETVLVHTGQHYDQLMSDAFFSDLGLPRPDVYLGVGSGSHAVQTAEIMKKFEEVLFRERPDALIVVGDVNSTLACALVTAKASFEAVGSRPLIAHVEAGLRSFDRSMPEEVNRIVTDQLSDLLFVSEESGLQNLIREGFPAARICFVGNTMIDSLLAYKDRADASSILDDLELRGHSPSGSPTVADYALLTLHRPANVDSRETFSRILDGLCELAEQLPVVFPAHPRTQKRIQELGLDHRFSRVEGRRGSIRFIDPLGYLDFLCLMKHARLVVTDSGGIQEETTCLGIPCVTVRDNTERPVTVQIGTNVIAGTTSEGIRDAVQHQLHMDGGALLPENWDGQAATRIVDALIDAHCSKFASPHSAPKCA
jgi:UDP-N-acetylglucosamine 2-epimerase (non-hydrolysing)